MNKLGLERGSLSLYEVADGVASADVAALLREYAAEFALQAKARKQERRLRRLAVTLDILSAGRIDIQHSRIMALARWMKPVKWLARR